MNKVRIPRRDQALDLILMQISRLLIKQGEHQQNPVCIRDQQRIQNQAPEQEQIEIGPVTVSEPGSPHNQVEDRPVLRT